MFYKQLDAVCKRQGTSVTAVLIALNISKGNIRNWKNGTIPKYETRLKIANHLGISVEDLLTPEEIEEREKQKQMLDNLFDTVSNLVPRQEFEKAIIDEISYAAYQELENETDEFKMDVLDYIKFKKSQKKE